MPNGVVKHLEARLLKDIVNRAIHPIRCAESCRQKYQKGMYIGDLCAETGHFWWARKVWRLTAHLIEQKDYDDWIWVRFNPKWVCLRDVVSETECELLVRRCSDLWRALGFPEYAWWDERWEEIAAQTFGSYYSNLWLEKYDYDPLTCTIEWDEELHEHEELLRTEQLFSDAQCEYVPLCAQNIIDYWREGPS